MNRLSGVRAAATTTTTTTAAAPASSPMMASASASSLASQLQHRELQIKLRFHSGEVRRAVLSGAEASLAGLLVRTRHMTDTPRETGWSFSYHDGVDMVAIVNEHDFDEAVRVATGKRSAEAVAANEPPALEIFVRSLAPSALPPAAAAAAVAALGLGPAVPRGATDPPTYEAVALPGDAGVGPAAVREAPFPGVLQHLDPSVRAAIEPVVTVFAVLYTELRPAFARVWARLGEHDLATVEGWQQRVIPLSNTQRVTLFGTVLVTLVLPLAVVVRSTFAIVGPVVGMGWVLFLMGLAVFVVRWIIIFQHQHAAHQHAQ